jgi:hypothetical protein
MRGYPLVSYARISSHIYTRRPCSTVCIAVLVSGMKAVLPRPTLTAPGGFPLFPSSDLMHYVAAFFAGAFLCNCLAHLIAGLQGMPFPTPFAKPHGVGDSSASVNFLWGFFNLLVALYLFSLHPFTLALTPELIAPLAGALSLGLWMSVHFGKVWRDKHAR